MIEIAGGLLLALVVLALLPVFVIALPWIVIGGACLIGGWVAVLLAQAVFGQLSMVGALLAALGGVGASWAAIDRASGARVAGKRKGRPGAP